MGHIFFQNIDRNYDKIKTILQNLLADTNKYAAILSEDCPEKLSPEVDQLLNSATASLTVYSSTLTDRKDENSFTRLISIINNNLCTANQYFELGNDKAASAIIKVQIINDGNPARTRQFYLANIYIKPKASPTDTKTLLQTIAKTVEYKTSRLVITGDVNVSSALWDPQNLDNCTKALKTKNKFYSDRTQRGTIIERFALRHNLEILPQTKRPTNTFIEPGIGENSNNVKGSLIDIALVGRKANRAWYAVKVGSADEGRSRQHLAIEVLASNKQQYGPKHKKVFRYRPQRILPYELMELKIKTSELRNNWKSCTRDTIIQRLERMTNLVIEAKKTPGDKGEGLSYETWGLA